MGIWALIPVSTGFIWVFRLQHLAVYYCFAYLPRPVWPFRVYFLGCFFVDRVHGACGLAKCLILCGLNNGVCGENSWPV